MAEFTQPVISVDETNLATNASASFAANFTSSYGADGAGSITYAVGINAGSTGLVDTATGQAVVLSLNAGVVEGRTASSNALVFTVSVDSAGLVTLDQIRAVVHPTTDANESKTLSADNLVTLTATITDKDGDTTNATVNIGSNLSFKDDGPSMFTPDEIYIKDAITSANVVNALNFSGHYGSDGLGNVVFNASMIGVAHDADTGAILKFNGATLYYHYGLTGGVQDTTILVASTINSTAAISINDASVAFWCDINAASGIYTMHSNGFISNGTETTATNSDVISAGNKPFAVLSDLGTTLQDAIITGSDTINTNSTTIGIGSGQNFGSGDGIRFDFVNGAAFHANGGGTSDDTFSYDGTHNLTTSFRDQVFVNGGGSNTASITLSAIIADGDNTMYQKPAGDSGENLLNLSGANIKVYNGTTLLTQGTDYFVTDNGDAAKTVTVTGLHDGWILEVNNALGFSAVQMDAATGTDAFKLGYFSYGETNIGHPVELLFNITGSDGDGDTVASYIEAELFPASATQIGDTNLANLNDTLTGTASDDYLIGLTGNDILNGNGGNDTLIGGYGTDTLNGGIGNDILVGNQGKDSLTGGAGSDTFKFEEGDLTDSDLVHGDTITDFSGVVVGGSSAGGDVIDLADLLTGAGIDTHTLNDALILNYVHLAVDPANAANTLVQVDLDGAGAGAAVTIATLQGTAFSPTLMADLLTQHQIDYTK